MLYIKQKSSETGYGNVDEAEEASCCWSTEIEEMTDERKNSNGV